MLIIAGYITVPPEDRDQAVATFADLVRRAREAPGCLDVAITADSVDPGRINNVERWRSWEDVDAWRAQARAPEVTILTDHVRMYDASNERSPF
ncbi:antibiotic biosynthesis monooxygenase family protein [Actinomycetospora sp. OC33-EN08]|uniref:Antibiotic biosynthesis monooxygenase family protein n=1 Tax=Actinomycetospora aurantiaca TaxID=3129233 RepID=A0ABU8MWF7_9PSEU